MNGFEPMSNGFEPMSLVLLKCQIVEKKDLINNFFYVWQNHAQTSLSLFLIFLKQNKIKPIQKARGKRLIIE